MKKFACAALMVGTVSLYQPVMAAGIPVFDVSAVTQQLLQVEHMITQINHLQSQIDQMRDVRGLANVIDSAYDLAVEVDPNAVLDTAGIRGSSDHGLSGNDAEVYDRANEDAAVWLGQSQRSLEQAKDRFHELTRLVAEVNNSPDPKDIMDLQARIGAEQVLLQNEMIKLSMLQSEAEANRAVHNQRIQQMSLESSGQLREVSW